jgi:hypothetical protein
MFNMDRQTLTLVAIAVCVGASLYLYRENQKQQVNFNNLVTVVSRMNQAPAHDLSKKKRKVTIAPEESVEVIDNAEDSAE